MKKLIEQTISDINKSDAEKIGIINSNFKFEKFKIISKLSMKLFLIIFLLSVMTLIFNEIDKKEYNSKLKQDNDSLVYVNQHLRWHLRDFEEVDNFKSFMFDVGFKESSNTWDTVSKNGAFGYFGMMQETLNLLGIDCDMEMFKTIPELQIGCYKLLLKTNYNDFNEYFKKYDGKFINNIDGKLTLSGLLMGFHHSPTNTIKFLESNGDSIGKPDGNKVFTYQFIQEFNNYNINLK